MTDPKRPSHPELRLVSSPRHIAESVVRFADTAVSNAQRARALFRTTTYWVVTSDGFRCGPGKFVGFRDMTFDLYRAAEHDQTTGTKHDGGLARNAIETVLGESFREDDSLRAPVREWGAQMFGPDVLSGVDTTKWRCIRLKDDPSFVVGSQYTRSQVQDRLSVSQSERGGKWSTGSVKHDGEWFIFANVGTPARTGHDYGNRWLGDKFEWKGRTESRSDHRSILDMTSGTATVHVFTREHDRDPFTYQGRARAGGVRDTVPVTVLWEIEDSGSRLAEELSHSVTEAYSEGARQQITVNAYERNPDARRRCIEHHGFSCAACDESLESRYGPLARGRIHVHHLAQLSLAGGEREVDPVRDLRPVCPNCHYILHLTTPPMSIERLREVIAQTARS